MFYSKDERDKLWERSQVGFAEKAHEFPCCDVPTVDACWKCKIDPSDCKNKAEIVRAIKAAVNFECPRCKSHNWEYGCADCGFF